MNKNHRSLPVFWCSPSPPLLCVSQIKMSQVKQVGLLAAGCQPWNKDVCAASEDRFAYCATLAIYVYQVISLAKIGVCACASVCLWTCVRACACVRPCWHACASRCVCSLPSLSKGHSKEMSNLQVISAIDVFLIYRYLCHSICLHMQHQYQCICTHAVGPQIQ